MKIILLSGCDSCGKTTTFNLLYDELIDNMNAQIIKKKKQLGANKKDFECILSYNSKKIALFSVGDFSRKVTSAFKDYEEMACDLLICACNDKFKLPYKKLKNDDKIVEKTFEENIKNHDKTNICDMKKIKKILSKFINILN